jgi:serine/threonine protein kinase
MLSMSFILGDMAIPEKIGRYIINSELGRGGMATVYQAHDPSFDREVAIKVLPREMLHDPQFRNRFERELKIVASLEHPAIVPVYDVGEENGQPYFVMRYMTGGSLAGQIEQGKFSVQDTARIVHKIAQGLAYAHKKGIVHRDLKPDNILFDDVGDPFISDFGVAKLTESHGSLTGSGIIGTPAYMSPEQAQGAPDLDGRSDVYGLGVIVYQMLSGQQPYNADTPMGVVIKHITDPVPEILKALPTLPAEVDPVIKKALAKDRTKRFQNTVDLAKALNVVAFGSEGSFTPTNLTGVRTGRVPTPTMSTRGKTGFAIGGVVLLLAVIGVFLLRNQLFPSAQATPTATATNTSVPTEAPTFTAAPPTESAPTVSPFAPACPSDLVLPVPDIPESAINKQCIKKVPYTTINIPEGATFESLNPGMTCKDEKPVNGKKFITCTGAPSTSYNLKVCMPPPVSQADAGKCDTGNFYDPGHQCCMPVTPETGCTTLKVDLRACQ